MRWKAWLKADSFPYAKRRAQPALVTILPLLRRSSASSLAYDLIFSSHDTWKRLPSVCTLDSLQSWGWLSEDLSYTQMGLWDTAHPTPIYNSLTASECLQTEASSLAGHEILLDSPSALPASFLPTPPHVSGHLAPGYASTGSCVCVLVKENHSSRKVFLVSASFSSQMHPDVCPCVLLLECQVFWEIQRASFRNCFKSQLQSTMVASIRRQPFAPLWLPPSSGQHQEVGGI